ncbi:MAG: hypothetical protein H0W57_01210 [Rubrobacteraceae bacterium]|nr:hypothetical protein [Rubrobacteraceae bacterium]
MFWENRSLVDGEISYPLGRDAAGYILFIFRRFRSQILRSTCRNNGASRTKLRDLRYYCALRWPKKGGNQLRE